MKTKILTWIAMILLSFTIASCSPYNGNRQHDTVVVAKKMRNSQSLRPKLYVRELMEYGYDEETANDIVEDAFRELTRGL